MYRVAIEQIQPRPAQPPWFRALAVITCDLCEYEEKIEIPANTTNFDQFFSERGWSRSTSGVDVCASHEGEG